MATRQEILDATKQKYPEYRDIPDDQLASALASKYPDYASDLSSSPPQPSPIAEQEAFKQRFIEVGTQDPLNQAISALTAGPRAGIGLAKGLGEAALKGVQGVGDIYGTAFAAGEEGGLGALLKNYYGNVAQTAQEIVPRASFDTANAIRMALQAPEASRRGLTSISNPIAGAIEALVNPQAAPNQAQALEDQIVNQAFEEQGKQGILEFAQQQAGLPSLGTANIDVARGLPLLIGAEAIPAAASNLAKNLPELIKQFARTGVTAATTPASFVRASRAAEPFLSGKKLAEAQAGVEGAVARQSALDRAIQEAAIKEQAAARQAAQGITEVEGAAAGKGLEAAMAQRELQTAQGTITPEIVQAQTSIAEAAQMPVVILGRTAEDAATFGRRTTSAVERPMAASEAQIKPAYDAVTEALPTKQKPVEAQPFFDAATESQGELSQGFEAYNKGAIKRILDESTRVTQVEIKVPSAIKNLYDSGTPAAKADLLKSYPELAQTTTGGTIPAYTWNELQARFRQINQAIAQALKYGDTNDARILGNLKRGITESMENYASQMGPDVYNLFQKANAKYAAHQDKFGLNRVQTLFKDDVLQNPELVARDLIALDNPSQVNAIKGIVSAEEFVPVQAQFSQKFFSPTPDVPFDPSHFVKQFSKPGARDTVIAVFGEQGLADFTRINDAAKSFAKVQDLQKTLDNLATQSESATAAFSKAKGTMTEAKRVLAEKNALKAELKATQDATRQADLASVNKGVEDALKELDRVKNYRDLKDWATRVSGLNILEAATTSPAWEQLARYSALHLDKYQDPQPSP